MEAEWSEHVDPESGKKYYVNSKTNESTWEQPTTIKRTEEESKERNKTSSTPTKKVGGLSALSRQLRELQSQNSEQTNEIERLRRTIKITTDMKGVSVQSIQESLRTACEGEAHGELLSEIASLRTKLLMAENQRSSQQASGAQFDREAASSQVATLELRVGELEELEDNLRKEISGIYKRLTEQSSLRAGLESTVVNLRADILQREHQHQQHQLQLQQSSSSSSSPLPSSTEAEAELELLRERVATLEKELASQAASSSQVSLLEEQLVMREKDSRLKNEQHEARFKVQDERIVDLTQQLSSLYTAFEMLQQEHMAENNRMQALQSNLHASDSQLAMQLHKEQIAEEKEQQQQQQQQQQQGEQRPPPPSLMPRSLPPGARAGPPPPPSSSSSSLPRTERVSLSRHASATMPATSNSSFEGAAGFLLKLSLSAAKSMSKGQKKSKFQHWKRRWFDFDGRSGQLMYRQNNGSQLKGTIGPLTSNSVITRLENFPKQPYAFALHVDDRPESEVVLYAAAETAEDYQMWLEVLNGFIGARGVSTFSSSSMTSSLPSSSITPTVSREEQEAADHALALRMAAEFQ